MQPYFSKLGNGDALTGAWLIAILIVTAIVYSRSIGGEFIGDDHATIIQNHYISGWDFLWTSLVNDQHWYVGPLNLPQSAYYRPLTNVWNAINFHLFGLHPAGWRATHIALHLFLVWLVFRVATLLTNDRWTALGTCGLFALFPTQADSAVYAIGAPLSAVFQMGAFAAYLRQIPNPSPQGNRWRSFGVSLCLFGCGLLAYETAAAFPALIAAHAFILRAGEPGKQKIAGSGRTRMALSAMWPYALEFIAYLMLRSWVLGGMLSPASESSLSEISFIDRVLNAGLQVPSFISAHIKLLLMPWRAAPQHLTFSPVTGIAAPGFYLPALALAALFGTSVLLIWRHPHRSLYLFCGAWFVIALLPALPSNAIHDRYLYLPSFGFCLMIADLAVVSSRRSETRLKAVRVGVAVVAVVCAMLLYSVQYFWHDDAAWHARYMEEFPKRARLHSSLPRQPDGWGDIDH